MGKVISNGYDGTADPISVENKARTNPWAEDTNYAKLYGIERYGGIYATGWDAAITLAGDTTTITPTAGNETPTPRYFKWVITDESGNEVFGALNLASPAAAVVIDSSTLDPQEEWTFLFSAEKEQADGGEQVIYKVKLAAGEAAANGSLSVSYTG